MGYIFHKTEVVTVVVITLVLFSVIPATVIDENIKHEDAKIAASKDVKESAVDQSWKEKITEGLGLQTEDAKDDTTVDSTNDKITGTGEDVADKASEAAGSAKDPSYESAQSAKDGAEYVTDAAYEATKDSAGYVQDSAYKTAESAKEGAGYVKDATYGKTELDAKEGPMKKGKNVMGNKYEEVAEPQRQKAKGFKDNVILGSGSYDEEL